MPLSVTLYWQNNKPVYPIIVGGTLLLQLTMVVAVAVLWRREFWLLRWSEKTRRAEWDRAMNRGICECMCGSAKFLSPER